jgi:hypothetical protein
MDSHSSEAVHKPAVSPEQVEKFISCLEPGHGHGAAADSEKISVHAAVSRVSVLYEKVRNALDYKDEHLLRKAALKRILQRQLTFAGTATAISKQLIKELIAAGYLPNGNVSVEMIPVVEGILQKYLLMRTYRAGNERHLRWILGLVVCELEERLDPKNPERALSVFLFESIVDRVVLRNIEMDETDRRLQIYIACLRALHKADDEMLSYKLVRAYHTRWMHPEAWGDQGQDVAFQMVGVERRIREQLQHPLGQKFLHAVKPPAVASRVLFDVLKDKAKEAQAKLQKLDNLMPEIEAAAEARMDYAKKRLRRGMLRTIIYLFLTKMLIALAFEVPVEQFFYKHIDNTALAINIAFPPLLMLLVGLLIRLPGKENIVKVQILIRQLLSKEGIDVREVKRATPKNFWSRFFLRLIYVIMFGVTFGLIAWVLNSWHFTPISSVIFLFFLCVVSFFAFRLRLSAREFVVVERPERFSTVIIDFFSYPILRAGQWLSVTVSRVNILIILMDLLIEAPFKFLLNGLEIWFAYMREQKEELQ